MRKIEGWKAIAAELGLSEKTARDCAKVDGLPVSVFRNRVFIMSGELQTWVKANTRLYSEAPESSEAA
ncbi:MAG: hypothetical protein ABI134_03160 [Byssovorax sp.]